MSDPKKVLVAIAWPYVNGDIHVGHLAGYLLPADIYARYRRLRGDDVLMVSGSDCYGTPITVEADKLGKTPEEVVDLYHPRDIELFKQYNLSYNLYTKTTTQNHKRVTQELFLDLLKNDYIVIDTMQQYYAAEDAEFLPDRYVEGECPHCGAKEQRSDQCESCGRWLEDGVLIDPVSKKTGAKVELKDTEHYFLDFANETLQKKLREYLDSKKGVWRKWVWNEANSWLVEGLRKRAITRDMDWAIELPVDEIMKLSKDKQLKDFTGKRIYVWFEAVMGYLSAPQEWSKRIADGDTDGDDVIFSQTAGQSSDWKDWWLNPGAEQVHFMGQDNLVFHTLMWQAELMGATEDYTIPHNIAVNKFMNYEGKKFSKSRNWTIDSKEIADKYGADLVRYYIASNLPENKTANFTWDGFVDAVNNELIANVGNLFNRTLKFIESKLDGKIASDTFKLDDALATAIDEQLAKTSAHFDKVELTAALEATMKLAKAGNQYFDQQEVWQVIKTDEAKAVRILLNLVNLLRTLTVLLEPFVPDAAVKMGEMLGMDLSVEVGKDHILETGGVEPIRELAVLGKVKILFEKLDKEEVLGRANS